MMKGRGAEEEKRRRRRKNRRMLLTLILHLESIILGKVGSRQKYEIIIQFHKRIMI